MDKGRFIVQSSRSCFRKWKNAPRILTLLGTIATFVIIYGLPFVENARAQGEPLQAGELFVAMMNWRFTMLVFSSAVLLLFGDLPVIEGFTANALIRGTRRTWMVSQIFYVLAASLILSLFIWVVSLVVSIPDLSFSNEWSRPTQLLARSGRLAIPPERMKLPMVKSLVTVYTPWQAFGHSFSLFCLLGCFYGMGALALKMRFGSGSLVLLLIVNAASWASGMFGVGEAGYAVLSILSVHYHASLADHANLPANPWLPSLGASYAILIGVVAALIALALVLVKRYDYVGAEEEQP
ncbi:hypothetical protein FACS1894196_3270 [Clostridia bacterium]|nr:hypothetical protein FACS1894196_3270 [Clostridia bacterium]